MRRLSGLILSLSDGMVKDVVGYCSVSVLLTSLRSGRYGIGTRYIRAARNKDIESR